jgi:hypothetical protein
MQRKPRRHDPLARAAAIWLGLVSGWYRSIGQRKIPRIAALHWIGSAAVRARILSITPSPQMAKSTNVGDLVFAFRQRRGRYSRNFVPGLESGIPRFSALPLGRDERVKAGKPFPLCIARHPDGWQYRRRRFWPLVQTEGEASILGLSPQVPSKWQPTTAPRTPQRVQFALQKMTYNLSGRQTDLGYTSEGRRTKELDLYLAWSGYTTGYTTSAEYPSFRAHSRAGPAVE